MMTAAAQAREGAVWKALSDPHRRRILDALRKRPMTTGQLAGSFEISRFGVMKHIKVLAAAGLVRAERRGRERWNSLNAVPIQEIYRRWIRPFEARQADGLLRLKRLAETPSGERAMSTETSTEFGVLDVTVEVEIEASPEVVWRALTEEIGEWWPRDFCVGDLERFVLEPKLGGRMYEDWGGGAGLIWAVVTGLRQGELLQLSGELSKDFGGPARNITTIKLRAEGDGTHVTLGDSVYGSVSAKTGTDLDAGWRHLFAGCLKPFVESNRTG